MGELKILLLAGLVALVLTYLVVTPGIIPARTGITGNYLATQTKYLQTTVAESAYVSSALFPIAKAEGTVKDEFNARPQTLTLPFSSKPDWFGKHGRGLIELTVTRADGGELVMELDGQEIYREAAKPGKHYIFFDKDVLTNEDVLDISASRGVTFWSTAEYDVRAEIKGEIISSVNTTFLTPAKYKTAKLIAAFDKTDGRLTVKVNGKIIYEGEPDQMLNIALDGLQKYNTIEFIPDTDSSNLIDWAEVRFE